MVIRNLKQKKMVNTKIIVGFVLLCLATYFLIKIAFGIIGRFTQVPQNDLYTLGASLTFSGKIIADKQFPNYTHSLTTADGKKIGIKSSTLNLNSYVDTSIEIVGRVKKYFKLTPVLEVDMIKLSDQGLIIKGNTYFFVKDFIYLDFSTQPQLSASKSGSDVQVWFDKAPVVTIERFVCSKILKTRDCTYLVNNYIDTNKDNFESYLNYTFYKHGTGFWATFDSNKYGYLFKDISDDMVLDMSNMFKIVNADFIVENKLDNIKASCKNDFSQFSTIDTDSTFTYHDPYSVTLGLQGFDKKHTPASCRVTFDIRNNRNVSDVQYN